MNLPDSKYSVEVDQIEVNEWTELLHRFNDATIYQTWQYGAVRWGEKNISHLILKKEREIVAAALLRIIKLPVFKGGMAYLRWGPVWKLKDKERTLNDLRQMIRCLRDEYIIRRRLFLRILPNVFDNEENANEIHSIFEAEGFRCKPSTYRTLILDLRPSMEELRENLSQKWRQDLKKSEKHGLKLIEGTDDELYKNVFRLYMEMLVRKGFIPGIDINEFREIQKQLPESIKMKIILCESNGVIINAIVSSYIGDTGIYLIGASANEGLDLRGSFLVQWRNIQRLKEHGCICYDLCGIDPVKNPGGYHFKSGLAGKARKDVWQLGQFDACGDFISFFTVNTMESLKKIFEVVLSKLRKAFEKD